MSVSRHGRSSWLWRVAGIVCAAVSVTHGTFAMAAEETEPHRRPVKVVAPERIKIKTTLGEAVVPAYVSADISKTHADIKRVVIVVHGRLRDADKYFDLTMRAAQASGALSETLIIAPQILTTGDAARHHLDPTLARWKGESWLAGDVGKASSPLSSFEVLDGIIARLSDRARFPKLERIVVAAHSGGAQYVQRYAVVGRADQVITAAGMQPYAEGMDVGESKGPVMRVRYVVANPSSYVYFDASRPHAVGNCKTYDHWRYGLVDPVPYAAGADMKALQRRYLTRRVMYLLGGMDSDPNHAALDKSCMAETQGANRLERGTHYFAHALKHANQQNLPLRHTRVEVPGVAHNADRMFNSLCGKAALFDTPGCEMKLGESITAPTVFVAPAAAVTPVVPAASHATDASAPPTTARAASPKH